MFRLECIPSLYSSLIKLDLPRLYGEGLGKENKSNILRSEILLVYVFHSKSSNSFWWNYTNISMKILIMVIIFFTSIQSTKSVSAN